VTSSASSAAVASAIERFAGLIREVTGNVVPEERFALLEELAHRRARALSYPDVPAYLQALAAGELPGEWDGLISVVTIKESYFFRAPQQFAALSREVLPPLLAARAEARSLRVWSAACARGEEPGTLALLFAETPALAGWSWRIFATDVDFEALELARRGLYSERAVAQVPPELLARFFTRRGKLYELDPDLRATIRYQTLNLAQPPYELPEEEFDLILLRNVLIYFKRPLQRRVVSEVARHLSRAGALFLGASETLWQIQEELDAVDLGGCFCYRHGAPGKPPAKRLEKRLVPRTAAREAPTGAPAKPAKRLAPQLPRAVAPAKRLAPRPAPTPGPSAPAPSRTLAERLRSVALLLADNRIAEAESALGDLLAAHPSDPVAQSLAGFLHDLSHRTEEAVTCYRAALYLDPALFQARLLLADCLLRLGHRDLAEKQFREVLTFLNAGRERTLAGLEALPLPDRERALRRCRQALGSG
jgi:chemotaxis protein methyltransferase CheR